jgi:hypothetical protein
LIFLGPESGGRFGDETACAARTTREGLATMRSCALMPAHERYRVDPIVRTAGMPLAPADHARTIAFVDSANWGPTRPSTEREWSGLTPAGERLAAEGAVSRLSIPDASFRARR